MRKCKQPAATFLVFELLVNRTAQGEFTSTSEITEMTGVSKANVVSALWTLQHYFTAVEAVQAAGELHWFATPDTDKRTRQVKERSLEVQPRRRKIRRQP